MFRKLYFRFTLAISFSVLIASCKKEEMVIPPSFSEFTAKDTVANYFIIDNPASVYKIPVGVSNVSNVDRIVNFAISSPTGAVQGTQYSISGNSITIPAGKAVDSILINGLFSGLTTGKKDTLILTLTSGDIDPGQVGKTFKLVLQKACNVILSGFAGSYKNVIDFQPPKANYGPYIIGIVPGTTSGTTGFLTVYNFWDVGATIRIDLDWTNINNQTITIPDQLLFVDPTVGPLRVRGAGTGTFSTCDNTLTLRFEVYETTRSYGIITTQVKK